MELPAIFNMVLPCCTIAHRTGTQETSVEPLPTNQETPIDPATVPIPEEPKDIEPSEDATPNLAEAITLMTSELRHRGNNSGHSAPKVKEPDTFDGTDPCKLNNFILLCNLYFRNNPSYFDDSAKVTFALTHLRGLALDFFEPTILDSDEAPEWLEDWTIFTATLRNQFGPIDPAADAEDNLDHLKMRDNQRILKYNVEFNRLAIQSGWDDGVLRHRYYSSLVERIKDNMGQLSKPSTLGKMKKLAHSIDARHWERLHEKSPSEKSTPPKSDKPSTNSNSNNTPAKKTQSSNNSSNKSTKPSSSDTSFKSTISDNLKDGKLTQQERQRCMDNKLCMYCSGTGHKASSCPKASSSASKANAHGAQATEKTSAPVVKMGIE